MTAYCIGTITVTSSVDWDAYRARVGATIAKFGGEVVLRGARELNFSGDAANTHVVVLRFFDIESAKRWHASSDYQALIPLRDKGARVSLVLYQE
jgi:uncharacterized protein (DUF1330 family)